MTRAKDIWFGPQFDGIAHEISKLAIACDIDIEADGIAEKVLHNDDTVCGRKNAEAFRMMREHLMALFELEQHALQRLEPGELREELDQVRKSIINLRAAGHPGS